MQRTAAITAPPCVAPPNIVYPRARTRCGLGRRGPGGGGGGVARRMARRRHATRMARDRTGVEESSLPSAQRSSGSSQHRCKCEPLGRTRQQAAADYFGRTAENWDDVRGLHYPAQEVEDTLLSAAGSGTFSLMVDLGTGTGRMISLFANRVQRAEGIDLSHQMRGPRFDGWWSMELEGG